MIVFSSIHNRGIRTVFVMTFGDACAAASVHRNRTLFFWVWTQHHKNGVLLRSTLVAAQASPNVITFRSLWFFRSPWYRSWRILPDTNRAIVHCMRLQCAKILLFKALVPLLLLDRLPFTDFPILMQWKRPYWFGSFSIFGEKNCLITKMYASINEVNEINRICDGMISVTIDVNVTIFVFPHNLETNCARKCIWTFNRESIVWSCPITSIFCCCSSSIRCCGC